MVEEFSQAAKGEGGRSKVLWNYELSDLFSTSDDLPRAPLCGAGSHLLPPWAWQNALTVMPCIRLPSEPPLLPQGCVLAASVDRVGSRYHQ
jgi:hypothetical protein